MAITNPPDAPSRSDQPAVFNAKMDAFLAWLVATVPEFNAIVGVVNIKGAWVSGTTYAVGDVVWSPINFQRYTRKTVGAGTTDPSSDSANWQPPEVVGTTLVTQGFTAFTSAGTAPNFTLDPSPAITAYAAGQRYRIKFHADGVGSDQLNISGKGNLNIKQYDSNGNKFPAVIVANMLSDVEYDGTDLVVLNPLPITPISGAVRQTVLSGPVDSNGLPAYGGSTGGNGVTTTAISSSTPIIVSAAAGFGVTGQLDRNGISTANLAFSNLVTSSTVTISIASPGVITWNAHPLTADDPVVFTTTGALPTGLTAGTTYYAVGGSIAANTFQVSATPGGTAINTSGTQSGIHTATVPTTYLSVDVGADGSLTPGSSIHAPVYQQGGNYSSVNGRLTYNWAEAIGKVGNGSSAVKSYRVIIGEVSVAAGAVTGITWYAIKGRYMSPAAGWPAASTRVALGANIGTDFVKCALAAINVTPQAGFTAGMKCYGLNVNNGTQYLPINPVIEDRNTVSFTNGVSAPLLVHRTTGVMTTLTVSNWNYQMLVERDW